MAAALILSLLAQTGAANTGYIANVPVTASEGYAPGERTPAALVVAEPNTLAERFGPESGARASEDRVVVDLARELSLEADADRGYLESSFLVDHEEKEVRALLAGLPAGTSSERAAWLENFVHEHLEDGLEVRGWAPASRVAAEPLGTCRENAVLLTALARAAGLPARYIAGLAIFVEADPPHAYGHAWAEVRIGGEWRRFDATRIDAETRVAYVPLYEQPEGASGFLTAVAEANRVGVSEIHLLDPNEP